MALLGKQAWRCLTERSSLMVRVLAGKYFPHESFLNARLGSNPSYTWRSILEAREVLKRGIRRRIGDGLSTRVWSDPWIPSTQSRMIISPRRDADIDMVVAELWTGDGCGWDMTKLRALFLPFEQDRILNLRISNAKPEDSWIWDLEKHGDYSVKSAYRALTQEQGEGSSECAREKYIWNRIWTAKALPRIKIFMWQLCNDALPTRYNLASRVRLTDGLCPVCNSEMETCLHLMGGCGLAGGLWDKLGLEVGSIFGHGRVREWVEAVWREWDSEEVELFMFGCWALWEARNKVVFKQEEAHVHKVGKRVEDLLGEMGSVQGVEGREVSLQVPRQRWAKPAEGWVKLNVDAGVKEGRGMGIGVGCRDSDGRVVWGLQERRSITPEPRMAEAEAIMEGVREARSRGHTRIVVESDCKVLIEALEKRSTGRSDFHLIVADIISACSSFESIVWSFVSRKLNTVAHELAHLSSLFGRRLFRGERMPDSVLLLAQNDIDNEV